MVCGHLPIHSNSVLNSRLFHLHNNFINHYLANQVNKLKNPFLHLF